MFLLLFYCKSNVSSILVIYNNRKVFFFFVLLQANAVSNNSKLLGYGRDRRLYSPLRRSSNFVYVFLVCRHEVFLKFSRWSLGTRVPNSSPLCQSIYNILHITLRFCASSTTIMLRIPSYSFSSQLCMRQILFQFSMVLCMPSVGFIVSFFFQVFHF